MVSYTYCTIIITYRKDHPPLFYARPQTKPDGSIDLFKWKCGIPGKDNTDWAGGMLHL